MSARRTAAEDRSEVGGKIDAFVLSVLLDTGHETFDCRRFGQFLRRRRGGARLTDDSRIVYSGTKFENRVDVRLSQSREDECELRPRQDERAIPVDWRYLRSLHNRSLPRRPLLRPNRGRRLSAKRGGTWPQAPEPALQSPSIPRLCRAVRRRHRRLPALSVTCTLLLLDLPP